MLKQSSLKLVIHFDHDMPNRQFKIINREDGHSITFNAMASPCEIIFDGFLEQPAIRIAEIITNEVWRIEDKYSRYNPNSFCSKINASKGTPIKIDKETFGLLDFANNAFLMSDGQFDITSGVLRKVWKFDTSDNIPTPEDIAKLLPLIGWGKVKYSTNEVTLPNGMEIDFGGIGKEYAVDKVGDLIGSLTKLPALINFGGDLLATEKRRNKEPWHVGIEHPAFKNRANTVISFFKGAIATSGDANRYLLKNTKRYGHILNVKTGWPIENPPRSITVASQSCSKAGMIATLSMLEGENAEDFLEENGFQHWIFRNK